MALLRLFGNRSLTIDGHGDDACRHAAQEFINNPVKKISPHSADLIDPGHTGIQQDAT